MAKSKRGFLVTTILILLVALTTLWSVYTLYGNQLIEDAYNQQSIDVLNNIFEGRNIHPLSHYQTSAKELVIYITFKAAITIALLILCYIGVKLIGTTALVFGVVIAIALLEGTLLMILKAEHLPKSLEQIPFFRNMYVQYDREVVQWVPECSKYDPELSYVLRMEGCVFRNREFSVSVAGNELGLRDSWDAMKEPEIISLGDSYAMGWGVEQEETYSEIIDQEVKNRVLNAAISSYGTAREMKSLKKLDTSKLKAVILQYSSNDLIENKELKESKNILPIMSESKYNETMKERKRSRAYYPARYTLESLLSLEKNLFNIVTDIKEDDPEKRDFRLEVELFLNAINNEATVGLSDIPIIVFDITDKSGKFYNELVRQLTAIKQENIIALNIRPKLDKENFFTYDSHLNKTGHRKVAEILLKELQKRELVILDKTL